MLPTDEVPPAFPFETAVAAADAAAPPVPTTILEII
jgi:hypothetical protein